jgi:hypothetical protein
MTGHAFALAMAALDEVNGPEGQARSSPAGGDVIDWRACETEVRRLRQRIFKASQEQDWPKVRNLQKLMLRSRANTQRAAGDAAQRGAQDRRDRRGSRLDSRCQGGRGRAGARVALDMESPRGQARVHTESIKPCETPPARHSDGGGIVP